MERQLPRSNMLSVWCDFNAAGWSGAADDTCYYVLDTHVLERHGAYEGMRVFVFDYDNEAHTILVGCEATLEWHKDGWRARPDPATWYVGSISTFEEKFEDGANNSTQ